MVISEEDDIRKVPVSILYDPVVIHGWFEFWRCRTVAAASTCRTRMKYINMILKKLQNRANTTDQANILRCRDMLKNYAQWFKRRIDMSDYRLDSQIQIGAWLTVRNIGQYF
jgi:cell fate regulator YaaT (PSP1 superfamily)